GPAVPPGWRVVCGSVILVGAERCAAGWGVTLVGGCGAGQLGWMPSKPPRDSPIGLGCLWCGLFLDNSTGCFLGGLCQMVLSGWITCICGLARISLFFVGEFDPGSGRTLAACLTHASRAERPLRGYSSGERVSNT